MLTLLALLIVFPAHAGDDLDLPEPASRPLTIPTPASRGLALPAPAKRPLFRIASVKPEGALMVLDDGVLDKLVRISQPGDYYTIPLPDRDADAELKVDHKSLDPKDDLDCCYIGLTAPDGEARLPLTRANSLRDFTVKYGGRTYKFRNTGNGNFIVKQ